MADSSRRRLHRRRSARIGKTILGNQICFHRAARGDSTIYITLLAESHTRLIAHLRGMEFFRPELITSAIYYISAFKVLEDAGLDGLLKSIQGCGGTRGARRSSCWTALVSAEEFAPSAGRSRSSSTSCRRSAA